MTLPAVYATRLPQKLCPVFEFSYFSILKQVVSAVSPPICPGGDREVKARATRQARATRCPGGGKEIKSEKGSATRR